MSHIRDISDTTPRFRRWPAGKGFVHKPPLPAPPSYLLVAIVQGHAMCLDTMTEPDLSPGDDYPPPGSFDLNYFDTPLSQDGFYIVEFSPVSVPIHGLDGTEWDVENRDSWRKLTDDEVKELVSHGFDNYLGEEQAKWKACLDAWPCQRCGRPCAEHISSEHPGWALPDLNGACPPQVDTVVTIEELTPRGTKVNIVADVLDQMFEAALDRDARLYQPSGALGFYGWYPNTFPGRECFVKVLAWSRASPKKPIAYLQVAEWFEAHEDGTRTSWWGFLVDTRKNRGKHNPHEIHEWTLYGHGPRELMQRVTDRHESPT